MVLDDAAAGAGKLGPARPRYPKIRNQSAQFARENTGIASPEVSPHDSRRGELPNPDVGSDRLSGPADFQVRHRARSSAGWPPTRHAGSKGELHAVYGAIVREDLLHERLVPPAT